MHTSATSQRMLASRTLQRASCVWDDSLLANNTAQSQATQGETQRRIGCAGATSQTAQTHVLHVLEAAHVKVLLLITLVVLIHPLQ